MNSRQRQGLLMVLLATALGVFAFLVAASYTARVNSQVGDKVTVFKVDKDLPALSEIGRGDVRAVTIPRRWVGAGVFTDSSFVGRKTFVPLSSGSFVDNASLIPVQEISKGEREIAINVDAESGVAGRIQPGDFVNVNVTMEEKSGGEDLRFASVLIQRARVISIGGSKSRSDAKGNLDEVIPVTFALSEADSLKLLYAESFGTTVRLSKLPVDDVTPESTKPFSSNDVIKEFGG